MPRIEIHVHVLTSVDTTTIRNKTRDHCSNDLITAIGIVEDIMTLL